MATFATVFLFYVFMALGFEGMWMKQEDRKEFPAMLSAIWPVLMLTFAVEFVYCTLKRAK